MELPAGPQIVSPFFALGAQFVQSFLHMFLGEQKQDFVKSVFDDTQARIYEANYSVFLVSARIY